MENNFADLATVKVCHTRPHSIGGKFKILRATDRLELEAPAFPRMPALRKSSFKVVGEHGPIFIRRGFCPVAHLFFDEDATTALFSRPIVTVVLGRRGRIFVAVLRRADRELLYHLRDGPPVQLRRYRHRVLRVVAHDVVESHLERGRLSHLISYLTGSWK